MSHYRLSRVTTDEATEFCGWTYGPGYGLYDLVRTDVEPMLRPGLNYYSVRRDDVLIGLACYGEDARIYGGPYEQAALDFGCCLSPRLVGQGQGRDFVAAVADFAVHRFAPPLLRLSVATGNARAIRVYEQIGFAVRRRFAGVVRGGTHPFLLMTRAVDAFNLSS